MMELNRQDCDREHAHIISAIDRNETRINDHSGRIKALENYQSSSEVKIENLVDQIENLVKAIYWLIGIGASSLVGFFVWYIQGL